MEGNSESVISWISDTNVKGLMEHPLLEDIKLQKIRCNVFKYSHIPRTANQAVDYIAKYALQENVSWQFNEIDAILSTILQADLQRNLQGCWDMQQEN